MKAFWQRFMFPIIGGGLGLLIAILFVSIGFFKTLLLIILTIVGILIGLYVKRLGILDGLLDQSDDY
ncbi:DUF2273 domain-containing protein [Lapidilactobacillus mulanensis]|uniref:DUF2273 domain-containing protein n=1 Tax=Lapidilactobacillus mulanensis TaxID=2485999 RepID=A0ABW4DME1_9LACO|nr:DUF2273 domain-containing protein [Lapidilactobacillus mulanensis]